MRKVKWGVLGVAKIADREGDPGDAARRGVATSPRSPRAISARRERPRTGSALRARIGSYEELLADRRDRGDLQSAAQRAPCALDDQGARGRQARAVREADRARRRGGARADRGAAAHRQAGRRSLHGALSSAMASRAGTRADRRHRRCPRDPDVLLLSPARPRQCAQPAAGRRRALRHRLLRDPHGALHFRRRADPRRRDDRPRPEFRTDRLASAILEFPGGRHSTFTVGTQMSAHQRVTIVGDAGRIEIKIPFNAPPDRPTKIAIDTGADLFGGGRGSSSFPSAISTRCRATPSRARSSTGRRSNSRSRTRSSTCGSSTRCSARPRADRGRGPERAQQKPSRPHKIKAGRNEIKARTQRFPSPAQQKAKSTFAWIHLLESIFPMVTSKSSLSPRSPQASRRAARSIRRRGDRYSTDSDFRKEMPDFFC